MGGQMQAKKQTAPLRWRAHGDSGGALVHPPTSLPPSDQEGCCYGWRCRAHEAVAPVAMGTDLQAAGGSRERRG